MAEISCPPQWAQSVYGMGSYYVEFWGGRGAIFWCCLFVSLFGGALLFV